MGDYPRETQNRIVFKSRLNLDCDPRLVPLVFLLKMASYFRRSGCHFLLDIDHPQRATSPENPQWQTFHLPFPFKAASYFRHFGGHFGWISTLLNGRLPQANAQSQTFHLPFYFKTASDLRRFWGSFRMDIDLPQWTTTPDKHAIAIIPSAIFI